MSEEDGPGSLAYPHDEADHGVRGGKIIHEQGETGETAIISCGTTKGNFVAKFYHDWSPHGYDRATALFQKGFFDQSHFFRVVPKFLVQFGISYTESKSLKQFAHTPIQDDPQQNPKIPFKRGTMSFAGSGPNSRTSQMFIAYGESEAFGRELWETPFGEVIEGMEHIEELYSYGDLPPWGKGPDQGKIHGDPNYIPNEFPLLDMFNKCEVIIHREGEEEMSIDAGERGDDTTDVAEEEEEERELEVGNTGDDDESKNRVFYGDAPPLKAAQRHLKSGKATPLGPFQDLMQVGMAVAGILVLMLGLAVVTKKGKSKKHKH